MVFAPLITTATVSSRPRKPAGEQRGQRSTAARLGDQAEPVPEQFLGPDDVPVADQHHLLHVLADHRKRVLADPRGASESMATLPPDVATGRPARSARARVGALSGSTQTTRARPA